MKQAFLEKVATRSLRVAVIGLGYVGLPLALQFVKSYVTVVGLDVDPRKVQISIER